jgi:hypothetical protein
MGIWGNMGVGNMGVGPYQGERFLLDSEFQWD